MAVRNLLKLSLEHYQNVQKKLQVALENSDFDAIVALSPENIVHLFGIFVPTHRTNPERLYLALFTKKRDPLLLVSSVAERSVRSQAEINDLRVYVEYQEPPIRAVANLIEERNLQKRKIGIEMDFLSATFYRELLGYLPNAEIVDSSEFLRKIRIIKDDEEIKLIKELAIITEKSIEKAFRLARPAKLENIKSNAISTIGRFGADHINFCVLDVMSSGSMRKDLRAGKESRTNIRRQDQLIEGELIKIDLSGDFRGYMSDILRLAVVGKPGKKLLKAYKVYVKLHREIIDVMRPGKRVCDVFAFYQRRFKEEGFVPRIGAHIGHSLGTCLHEHPMINAAHSDLLVPNMVMNVEPVGAVPALNGTRLQLESSILITEDKPQLLSTYTDLNELYTI